MLLITGPTGNVGRHVVTQLVAAQAEIRIFARNRAKAVQLLGSGGYEIVEGDFDDAKAVSKAMRGIDGVYFVSLESDEYVAQMDTMLSIAKQEGIQRAVLLSARADIASHVPFFRWHGIIERMVLNSGIPCTLLRPAWFMQNFLEGSAGGAIRFAGGEGLMGFIDTRDIGSVIVKALTEPGHQPKLYLLTGPEAIDHHRVAQILSECSGKQFTYHALDPAEFKRELIAGGKDEAFAQLSVDITEYMRRKYSGELFPDLKQILGRDGITFRQFALDHAAQLRRLAG
jgi:uncharacterized protein YbjT (DUF2867 family)